MSLSRSNQLDEITDRVYELSKPSLRAFLAENLVDASQRNLDILRAALYVQTRLLAVAKLSYLISPMAIVSGVVGASVGAVWLSGIILSSVGVVALVTGFISDVRLSYAKMITESKINALQSEQDKQTEEKIFDQQV